MLSQIFTSPLLLLPALVAGLTLSGCAGPATPLGSVWASRPDEAARLIASDEPQSPTVGAEGVKIEFHPARQVLHGPKPFIVHIEDPNGIGAEPRIQVRYDGVDVTTSFLRQATFYRSRSSNEIDLKIPVVRLSPEEDHRIEVRYYNAIGQVSSSQYRPPVCRVFDLRTVRHTDEFDPAPDLLATIEKLAEEAQVNPALVAGLIAQESGFNPRTVSWAKAMGLTQVTPIAESELVSTDEYYERWPRYEGVDHLPASLIKMLVLTGRINERNDWRLDRKLSVQGGLAYLHLLEEKWSTPDMKARFDETERTKLLLASYNSGYTRVLTALRTYGKNWITSPELHEARRYVNRISSYCDYFSQDPKDINDQLTKMGIGDNGYENQT
jgi:hypothetical protein